MLCSWIKESFMNEFSSTEEVITFCFADFSIGSNAKGLVFEELNSFESNSFVLLCLLLSHCGYAGHAHKLCIPTSSRY